MAKLVGVWGGVGLSWEGWGEVQIWNVRKHYLALVLVVSSPRLLYYEIGILLQFLSFSLVRARDYLT